MEALGSLWEFWRVRSGEEELMAVLHASPFPKLLLFAFWSVDIMMSCTLGSSMDIRNNLGRAPFYYVAVYIATIPFWAVLLPYKDRVAHNGLCAAVNSLFIQHYGYVWFTLAYMGHIFLFVEPNGKITYPVLARQSTKYALSMLFTIAFNSWFFGLLIVERLNVATGGHCSVDLGMDDCRRDPAAVWQDGFDLSGHYYFLLTLGLLLWDNHMNRPRRGDIETQTKRLVHALQTLLQLLSTALLVIWSLEFCVTSLFFHTVGERAAGLVAIPIVYFVVWTGNAVGVFCEDDR